MKSKVYFSKTITSEKVLELYKVLGIELKGNVAIKVHSGEKGNQNFLRPDFWKPIIDYVDGTVVECNTAYDGERNTTEKHLKLIEEHGWSKYFKCDLLDAEGPDMVLDIPNGKIINKNYVGKNLANYDSMLVLSHFKGHPMGGYGGALKQLSIGIASSYGKAYIHGAGDPEKIWTADHDKFLESMADSAGSIVEYFNGNVVLTLLTLEYVVLSGVMSPFEEGTFISQSGPHTKSGVSLKKKSYSYVLFVFLQIGLTYTNTSSTII